MTLCVGVGRLLEGRWREFEVKDYISSGGRRGGSDGGGEWFGGVITKGREGKVNVGFGFGFGFGPEAASFQVAVLQLAFMQRR
jgi:hypothetical protein